MKTKLHAISAAVLLACAAAAPAYAGLERAGPVNPTPSVGGFPAWYQDQTGITLEFCDLTTQAEWDNGWCLLAPPDGPAGGLPEAFPTNFFDEHFWYAADNVMLDPANGFRAKLVIALEAAFAAELPIQGDQTVFARHRIDIRPLPFDGDYRVITPFSDVTYFDQAAGDRIFATEDVGIACTPGNFDCALGGKLGPFLLPSPVAGGSEVPPMPDLQTSPAGTDPFYDQLVALNGAPTPAPGTGKKYLADPARVGPVTGSPLPDITTYDTDGTSKLRNHNTFRIEVRPSTPDRNAPVFYTLDGETNFTVMGRLSNANLPGRVSGGRAVYRADAVGNATDVDVFTTGNATLQARQPGQPLQGKVKPTLAFWPEPCAGAIAADGSVTQGPYAAPAGAPTNLVNDEGTADYWGQVQMTTPVAKPATHVCIVDTSARNGAGQAQPAYMLKQLTDEVLVNSAGYNGPVDGGTLAVTAQSSDPTAVLTLAGFGSTPDPVTGVYSGRGPGAELVSNSVTVKGIKSPPSQVQVASSKGGGGFRPVKTERGMSVAAGQASAANVVGSVSEDCATTASLSCAAGQGVQIDLLANTTFQGQPLRQQVGAGTATVAVTVIQGARLGTATVTPDGFLNFAPNPNVSGTDSVTFAVSVNGGPASEPASAAITITAVNDLPVAGNTATNAVQGVRMSLNLIANASDPDGNTDVKNAAITSWPPELGPQPTPVNGSISFTPNAVGNFAIGFKVVDAAGAQSTNTGTATVTAIAGETITLTRVQFEAGKGRWRVDGTDTIQASQTISITFANGTIGKGPNVGKTCDGSGTLPECQIGTTGVTNTNTFSLDQSFSANAFQSPTAAGGWSVLPTQVRAWSSNPVLGGGVTQGIVRK
ncbi:IPT/TIG domain-containing protein [Ramlibacter monticola]|uniref:RapA2 cadherin-like domain-containing protein n=1 Tax=Ramlibacter monticola TaxID=1926872 RepID=A0A937CWS4_9BURK|nr:Ig-like domain-containing protein [Ramlibacter monticola]MBL0394878.1 hypothetical protein [Ramlibacter monticola]